MNGGEGEQEALDLPVHADGPSESVEIELTEEDLGENLADFDYEGGEEEEAEPEAEAEAEEEAEPEAEAEAEEEEAEEEEEEQPRKKRSPENRIQELARRAQEAERRAQEYESRLAEEAELRRKSDLAMMTHYEERLKRDAAVVKTQLQEAISMGDTEKQVELQAEYFQLQADLGGVKSWRESQANVEMEAPQQRQRQAEPEPEQAPQVSLEPRTAKWIEKNTWFQPQSADFDPDMHEEATLYARKVERRYKIEGREDEIGGLEYFTEIDRYMRREFPTAFHDPAPVKKAAPPMARSGNVAPVARTGVPGQAVKKTATVTLSPDQRKMAHTMADTGAYRHPNGSRMNHQEAEKYHASFILKQTRR